VYENLPCLVATKDLNSGIRPIQGNFLACTTLDLTWMTNDFIIGFRALRMLENSPRQLQLS